MSSRPYNPSVPTTQSIRRTQRWLDRRRQEADEILGAMRRGATLVSHFDRYGRRWRLNTGERVAADVVELVCADPRVVGTGDSLFGDVALSQTFRWCGK
jgi:hypothetical protein